MPAYVYGASKQRAQRPQRPEGRPAAPAPPPRAPRPCVTPTATHPAPPARGAEQLRWFSPTGDRLRVLESTCESCEGASYEYGLIGGAYRIRRTVRRTGKVTTWHETPAVRHPIAAQWWRDLLSGRAV